MKWPLLKRHGISRQLLADVTVARVLAKDPLLLKGLSRLQDEVFSCHRHNRLKELEDVVLQVDRAALFVAFSENSLSGFIQIRHFRRRDEWVVKGIGVAKYYRRKGIGSALLAEAKRFVNNELGMRLVSYVNKKNMASVRLHEKMGFRVDESVSHPDSNRLFRLVAVS